MQTRKQTAEESGQSSPPVLVVVVTKREKRSLAANIGMDGHMSNFCEERKFLLDPFFLRFSLHRIAHVDDKVIGVKMTVVTPQTIE